MAEAIKTHVLSPKEREGVNAWWRAANYLSLGMLYLQNNPLLRTPLSPEDIKPRLLGHWGSDPGQNFIWAHLNRVIRRDDLNMLYIAGPGHGAPATLANAYLEGTYSEVYPDRSLDEAGLRQFFRLFSFPGGVGSHCTPETPGSIHEGGELGYSLAHGYGAAFDNPDLIVAVVVGDGEAETGPAATAWHSNKFLNPARDGAVLPILHLNGFKLANPSILGRISEKELLDLFRGYGYTPHIVSGNDPERMHDEMASTLDHCIADIHHIQKAARKSPSTLSRPLWPMIILRTPKGWTAPKTLDGHQIEGSWRAHQIPVLDVTTNPEHLAVLDEWLKSYHAEELFDESGRLREELQALSPRGDRRMSANPHTNGGRIMEPLRLPNFEDYQVMFDNPGQLMKENTYILGEYLRDVMRENMHNFRVFGPDETASNRLQALFEVSKKTWMADSEDVDADGGELAQDGRVMEMLSEHTLEGWLEGYILTGRHGLLNTYEAFVHVIDSMVNQHSKWIEKASTEVPWRAPVPSLNILISSTVWRQDHNGFTHQDPGFLDVVTNKKADVVRIYLPPDANCLLSVADHCLTSTNYVNIIVADKQPHLQYLTMDEAVTHCTKGIGMWPWASNDTGSIPDAVIAGAGDVSTMEALAAVSILNEKIPQLKIRFVNVVDLFKLPPLNQHPHGMTDQDFVGLFTPSQPVIFNFHGYPALIHKLIYRRPNHEHFHVHGYQEMGSINTPLQLAMENHIDRFSLAIDVIDHVPEYAVSAAAVKQWLQDQRIAHLDYARREGMDPVALTNWRWAEKTDQ